MQVSIKAIDIQNLYFEMRLFGVRPRSYFILLRQKFINSANAVCKSIYHFNAWRRRWWKGCSQRRQFVSKTCNATICQYKVSSEKDAVKRGNWCQTFIAKKTRFQIVRWTNPHLAASLRSWLAFNWVKLDLWVTFFSRIAHIFRSSRQNWYTWVKPTLLTSNLCLFQLLQHVLSTN